MENFGPDNGCVVTLARLADVDEIIGQGSNLRLPLVDTLRADGQSWCGRTSRTATDTNETKQEQQNRQAQQTRVWHRWPPYGMRSG